MEVEWCTVVVLMYSRWSPSLYGGDVVAGRCCIVVWCMLVVASVATIGLSVCCSFTSWMLWSSSLVVTAVEVGGSQCRCLSLES